MPLMSRKTDYALLILTSLHQQPGRGCARAIADALGLSRPFVANILKELCQKGFVTSRRGVKGGYVLQRSAEAITLAEILEALDDSFHLVECTQPGFGPPCCVGPRCPVREQLLEVHQRICDVLRTVTLVDLFHPPSSRDKEPVPLPLKQRVPRSSGTKSMAEVGICGS